MPIFWGALIIGSIAAPYFLPAPTPSEPPPPENGLFKVSLILGIAISIATLYSYIKRGL